MHQSPLGFWVLTRYEDVVASLRDPRMIKEPIAAFVAARFGLPAPPLGMGLSMLDRDPPDHTRLRGLVSKAFTPRVIEQLRPHIQQIVDGLLDRVQGDRGMDLIEQFAYPLPVIVICEMLGVPVADHERFKGWGLDIARGPRRHHAAAGLAGGGAQRARAPRPRRLLPRAHRRAPPGAARRHAIGPHRRRGGGRQAQRGRAARHLHPPPRRRARDHREPDRQRLAGPPAPSRSAPPAPGGSRAHRHRGGGAAALRRPGAAHRAHPQRGRHHRRQDHRQGRDGDALHRRRRPRSRPVPRPRSPGHRRAPTTATSPSAGASTSASARRSRGWRGRSPSTRCCGGCPSSRSPPTEPRAPPEPDPARAASLPVSF